ncbi:hypothetical protein BGZ65_003052 [Modicella reniformis]|uniref:Uncharacterized protein n=1 Tax=Modicella reniformis TaxID=1440133 RepID=A0A9P6IZW7_9FUNG|nr:hypothetical protein BGZ65_003052 [Modicella reniformis]
MYGYKYRVMRQIRAGQGFEAPHLPPMTEQQRRCLGYQVQPMNSQPSTDIDIDLAHALAAHDFGRLVYDELERYELLDLETCQQPYPEQKKITAQKLAGSLIQAGTTVLLVLKAEIYVKHDGARKVMVGTNFWLALITSAVLLTLGKVIVGPNNNDFFPDSRSVVWMRKDYEQNTLVERQLRSKYDERTFSNSASVFRYFEHLSYLPVTLKTIWEHFIPKAASGKKYGQRYFSTCLRRGRFHEADCKNTWRL